MSAATYPPVKNSTLAGGSSALTLLLNNLMRSTKRPRRWPLGLVKASAGAVSLISLVGRVNASSNLLRASVLMFLAS